MSAPRAAAGAGAAQRPVLTSVVLQGALYFGKLYDVIYFVLSFLIFLYKGFTLPYPDHIFGMEFTCVRRGQRGEQRAKRRARKRFPRLGTRRTACPCTRSKRRSSNEGCVLRMHAHA